MFSPKQDFFSFNLKYLCATGLWANDDWPIKWKKYYKIYNKSLEIGSIFSILLSIVGSYIIRHNFVDLMGNLVKVLVGLNYIPKAVLFNQSGDKIKELIDDIKISGDMISERRNKIMTSMPVVITLVSMAIFGSFTVMDIIKFKLPVVVWVPYDINIKINYFVTLQLVLISFAVIQCRAAATQGIVCSLVMYLCDQLDELQIRITNVKFSVSKVDVEMEKEFRNIIKKHIRLIRYGNSMKIIFQEFFLIQNLAVTLELCLNAVMVTSLGVDPKRLITFLAFLMVALINAYIYCYLGNEMIIKSQGLALAAYEANWTSWPTTLQKNLLIMITVSQRPLFLSAAGLVPMSIQIFARTLYNGYSIFAVLEDVMH